MIGKKSEFVNNKVCYGDIFDKIHGLEGSDRRSIAYIKRKNAIEKEEYDAECRSEALAS